MDLLQWLQDHPVLLAGVAGGLILIALIQRVRARRRRRAEPPRLHPKLQAYAGRSEAEIEADRQQAAKIIATSSTGTVAGYEILRQIEAVYVDGYRTPQDATEALKAVAGRRGANALVNLSQQRTAAGRCTAQGDAVRIRPLPPKQRQPAD